MAFLLKDTYQLNTYNVFSTFCSNSKPVSLQKLSSLACGWKYLKVQSTNINIKLINNLKQPS